MWVFLSTVWPRWPEALEIVNADTVKRWGRQGFRHYLLGKSQQCRPGRPAIEPETPKPYPTHEPAKCALGRASNPRRASETRRGCLPDHCRKAHGPPRWPTVTALECLSSQSRPGSCPQRNIFKTHQELSIAYHPVAGAVNYWLTALFCNLLSLPATSARCIVDEPVSYHSIPRLRQQTVITPVGFAGRGPPVVKQLFNDSSSPGTPVAVVCPAPIGYTDIYSFRCREVTQTIHLHHFPHRSNRLAA